MLGHMKGLSVLLTLALLVTAHLLSVQLRRTHALPQQPHPQRQMATTQPAQRAARTPTQDEAIYRL